MSVEEGAGTGAAVDADADVSEAFTFVLFGVLGAGAVEFCRVAVGLEAGLDSGLAERPGSTSMGASPSFESV